MTARHNVVTTVCQTDEPHLATSARAFPALILVVLMFGLASCVSQTVSQAGSASAVIGIHNIDGRSELIGRWSPASSLGFTPSPPGCLRPGGMGSRRADCSCSTCQPASGYRTYNGPGDQLRDSSSSAKKNYKKSAHMAEEVNQQIVPEAVQAWLETEAVQMATRENFPQVFRDPDTGRYVDFAKIVDVDELCSTSRHVEDHYLRSIDEERQKFVTSQDSLDQEEALRQFEREMNKLDLYYLTKFTLGGYPDLSFHLHYFMAGTMQDLPPGWRGLREFPRDSYKSTVMNIASNVQDIIRDPNVRILIKSNAEANAATKLVECKNAFMTDRHTAPFGTPDYERFHPHNAGCLSLKECFPEMEPKTSAQRGSGTRWECPAKTSVQAEGTLNAAGVGSSKTSQHYDKVLGDDFWDENSVTSPEVMSKTRSEMNRLEYLLANPAEGKIGYVGTRFAHDDPTVDLCQNPSYDVTICSGVTPEGRPLFPENIPAKHMYSKAVTQAYDFSCQIMLNPTDDSRGFKREWIRYMRYSELWEQAQRGELSYVVRLLTDAAVDDKSTSDEVAIAAVAFDSMERMIVLEITREKMQPSDFINELYRLGEKYRVEFAVRQKTAIETTIMSFVNKEQSRRHESGEYTLRFYDYSLRKRDKKQRITGALQPPLQSGRLLFDPDMSAINDVEREVLDHPNTQVDHAVDALSEIDDPVVSRVPQHTPPTPREPEQYIPGKEDMPPDQLFKRQQAQSLFEKRRQNNKRLANAGPGVRIQ